MTAKPIGFRSHLKRSYPPFSIRSIYQSRWTWFVILVSFLRSIHFVSNSYHTNCMHGNMYGCMWYHSHWWNGKPQNDNQMRWIMIQSKSSPTAAVFYLRFVHYTNGYWIISALHLPKWRVKSNSVPDYRTSIWSIHFFLLFNWCFLWVFCVLNGFVRSMSNTNFNLNTKQLSDLHENNKERLLFKNKRTKKKN